jgi:hypothetical protein
MAKLVAIVGMKSPQEEIEIQRLRSREAKQRTPLFSGLDLIGFEVANSDAQLSGVSGQLQPMFAFF